MSQKIYATNAERLAAKAARMRKWRAQHPEAAIARSRAATERYRGSISARVRAFVDSARFRAKECCAAGNLTFGEVRALIGLPCVYCNGPADSFDHVVPFSRGGSNSIDNVVPSCLTCNLRKGPRTLTQTVLWAPTLSHISEWARARGLTLTEDDLASLLITVTRPADKGWERQPR